MSLLPTFSSLGLKMDELMPITEPVTRSTPASGSESVSDGTKTVNYRPIRSRNVRPVPVDPRLSNNDSRGRESVRQAVDGLRPFPRLPIMDHKQQILELAKTNQVFALDSPTGTGKTRYVPYMLAEELKVRVRVAIPTTVGVRDAYNFIFKHTSIPVGYAAGRETKYSANTQLVFGTTGHFTQKILYMARSDPTNLKAQVKDLMGDIVFIDEIHTGNLETTLLMGLLSYIFPTTSFREAGPKIVFASATLNQEDIIQFYSRFPVYSIDMNRFPVEEKFLREPFDPLRDEVNDKIIEVVKAEFTTWNSQPKKFHIIVFRPGVYEIEKTIEVLEKAFLESDPIEFLPAHSRLSTEELDAIFKPSNKMKVVVGTNIIESSITIEDVGVVIDDMLIKVAETSASGGNKLRLAYVSKAEAMQRAGRTGRTMPGRAYMLCNKQFFMQLDAYRPRELERIPIYNTILSLLDAGFSPVDILKVSTERYQTARKVLSDFNMIQLGNQVTETGHFVSQISVGIQNAYLVYLGYQEFAKDPRNMEQQIIFRTILAVASMLEVGAGEIFFIPRKTRNESESDYQIRRLAHIEKYHETFRGDTDIHTLVNVFWDLITYVQNIKSFDMTYRTGFYNYVKDFSIKYSLNNRVMREALTILNDLETETLSILKQQINLWINVPDGGYHELGNKVAKQFGVAYKANILQKGISSMGKVGYLSEAKILYLVTKRSTFSRIPIGTAAEPVKIIAAELFEIQSRGITNVASILISEKYL